MTTAWTERPEGGGRTALRLLIAIALRLGRAPARLVLYPVVLYFMFRRGPERRASRDYLSRALGRSATAADVFQHVLRFAQVTLDRVFLLHDGLQRFDIKTTGLDDAHAAMALNRGVLVFGAHFGSFEVLRALSEQRPDIRFRAVIDLEQNPSVSQLMNALNPGLAATVINARQAGPAVALAMKDALDQRAFVTLLVDRVRPGGRISEAEFLGNRAPFPTAAWEIAAALGAPVVLCFGVYLGGNRYHLYFEVMAERIVRHRDGGKPLSEWIQVFADRLATRAREAPYNWFNFYDFWAG